MSEWRSVRIGDVAEIFDGPHATPAKVDTGPVFLGISSLASGRLNLSESEHLSEEDFVRWTRRILPAPGDVVFSYETRIGEAALIPSGLRCCLGRRMGLVRPNTKKLDAQFFLYQYLSPDFQEFLRSRTIHGSTVDRIALKEFPDFSIKLPPLDTQRTIARILGDLDDKIELNRQINQTFEQMAQAIFNSWFVDFGPVKAKIEAKAEGRDHERATMCDISGKTEVELSQLPEAKRQELANTAALFPDELVESEIGLIPKGWEVKSLPDAIEVNPSRALKKGAITPYLDMANVPTNSVRVANVIQREFSSGSKFMNGDTLLARITPCLENGKTAYVDFLAKDQVGWGSTEFIVFRPKAPLPKAFAYLLCRHPDFRAFAIANMSGTSGRQRVPNDCFANYKLAVPSSDVVSSFGETVAGIMDGIKTRDEEARSLATLRDTLLPKLLSGELPVGECECHA